MIRFFLAAPILALSLGLISCASNKSDATMADNNYQPKPDLAAAAHTNIEIGMVLLKKGDPEAAKGSFLRALTQAPNNPETWYAMGYFYEFTGNSAEAERDYRKAIALAPRADAGAARNNYGAFLCREKRYREGLKQVLIAAESPNYLNTAEAYENAGLCAQRIPDTKSAIFYFQKALQNDPRRSGSLYSLAKIYSAMGNKALAQQYMEKYRKVMAAST